MIIVLDSNAITADFEMQGVDCTSLLDSVLLTEHRIGIPEVVIDEVASNYRGVLTDTAASLRKSVRSSRGVFPKGRVQIPTEEEISSLTDDYANRLRARLEKYQAIFLPYPDVSHQEVVQHVLASKRPFTNDDEGYRDMLVWRTMTNCSGVDEAWDGIVFVSNDRSAFGAGKRDELHQDLLADLDDAGLYEGIQWYRHVREYLDEHTEALGLSITDFMDSFPEGDFETDVSRQLTAFLSEELRGREIDPRKLGFPAEVENALILGVGDIEFGEIESAERTLTNKIICSATLIVEANILYYVFKADSYLMSDEEQARLSSYDNSHYFEGEDFQTLTVHVRFTFDPVERKITTIDPPDHAYSFDRD